MYIKASASIRNKYNEISKLCKESGEPVYLTKNGEGDLVVMDIASFDRRAKDLQIAENLYNIRVSRNNGAAGYSVAEAREILTKTINSVNNI